MANIFLLEDDKILSRGISIALEKDGHHITTAFGYVDALQKYQAKKYDLFLLDINLPDGNGINFCQKIRQASQLPVLFLTANDTEEDMLNGYDAGCDDYISKPFSLDVLRRKVSAILKRTITDHVRVQYKALEVDMEKCLVLLDGEEIHLSTTEFKLLCYLMQHKGLIC